MSPALPTGLSEALQQLASLERWASPERMSDENPAAGAAEQVTLVLCGRVAALLRAALACPEQAESSFEAVRRTLGFETGLAKRLGEVLCVEAGCILTTGEPAADQGVAVVSDFLSTYMRLEQRHRDYVSSQGDCEIGQDLGNLLLPTLLECILAGTTRSWECDWEAVQPQLQPLHDVALEQPLLERAASVLLRLVRDRAPLLLPEQPDSDVEEEREEMERRHQRLQGSSEPSPRCLYSLACLAQEIFDGLVAAGVHEAHLEEISQMVQLQTQVLQRLALQGRSRRNQASVTDASAPATPISQPVECTKTTPPARRGKASGSTVLTPPKVVLDTKATKATTGQAVKVKKTDNGSVKRACPTRSAVPPDEIAPAPGCSHVPTSLSVQSKVASNPIEGIRGLMEELVSGSGAFQLSSCLVARAERAVDIIAAVCLTPGKDGSEAIVAAGKLSDIARYLQLLLELSSEGCSAVRAHSGKFVRFLLQAAVWPARWRQVLGTMLELVIHPLLAKQAAEALWDSVISSDTDAQQSGSTALGVGSLATELAAVLATEAEEEAKGALASMNCLKVSAQLHLQWLGQIVSDVCGPSEKQPGPTHCSASPLHGDVGAEVQQANEQRCSDSKAAHCDDSPLPGDSGAGMLSANRHISSDSEADESEDIGSEETPSAPSLASGDRASDLEDFIDLAPEHNRFGLIANPMSPPIGPSPSGATGVGIQHSSAQVDEDEATEASKPSLKPKVQDFYDSKLAPDWEARIRKAIHKDSDLTTAVCEEAPASPAVCSKLISKYDIVDEPPLKRQRWELPGHSGLTRTPPVGTCG